MSLWIWCVGPAFIVAGVLIGRYARGSDQRSVRALAQTAFRHGPTGEHVTTTNRIAAQAVLLCTAGLLATVGELLYACALIAAGSPLVP